MKSTIQQMYQRSTNYLLDVLGLDDLKAPVTTYSIEPRPLRSYITTNTTIWRQPEAYRGLKSVPKDFDPDSRLHQRYLVKATEKNFQGGTDGIQTAMGKVGIDLTDAQAFAALSEHVETLKASGMEL